MANKDIKVEVDATNLDEAIEKANQLIGLLTQAQEIINSLSNTEIKVS